MSRQRLLIRAFAAGTILSGLTGLPLAASAKTPAGTLVEGFAIDDIISMDPAESFELSAAEVISNCYSQLVRLDLTDTTKVKGDLAQSWTISPDGLTYTFKLKPGLVFASGNPITAGDLAWSFERMVKLDKSPAFLIEQLGLTPDNVTERARALDPTTFVLTVDKPYAPSFVLNVMAASPVSAIDHTLMMAHIKDNDFGNGWLKTHYAGSGPFTIRDWRANQVVVMDRNARFYGAKAKLARVIFRYMKESSGQRLALEAGDIDGARNLEPGDLDAVRKNPDVAVASALKGTVYYISFNQKRPDLAKPDVRQAMKYLLDYDAVGATLLQNVGVIHQTFLPRGQLGAFDGNPYKLDIAKAKALLAKAGLPNGFSVTMDVRNTEPVTGIAQAFQQSAAEAGIRISILPGDGKQTLTKYRARNHDIYIGQWGSDYWDPNSNAQAFASNPDNSDGAKIRTSAWRNAWNIPELTKETDAALLEKDSAKRAAMYQAIQKSVLETGPFLFIYQQQEVAGVRSTVRDFKLGPTFDSNFLAGISKS
jgi:peptide/nickel transport system substrate-binding protein